MLSLQTLKKSIKKAIQHSPLWPVLQPVLDYCKVSFRRIRKRASGVPQILRQELKGRRQSKKMISSESWCDEITQFFDISKEEAVHWGESIRIKSRLDFLNSPWGSLWKQCDRTHIEGLHQFWSDAALGIACRQARIHWNKNYSKLAKNLAPGMKVCEYGAGIAPITAWLMQHLDFPLEFTVVDVPSRLHEFAQWRLRNKMRSSKPEFLLNAIEVQTEALPLTDYYDVIFFFDVVEHLMNPCEVVTHLLDHLKPQGMLWLNYVDDRGALDGTSRNPTNTEVAQRLRPQIFSLLERRCNLTIKHGNKLCWTNKVSIDSSEGQGHLLREMVRT